MKRSAPLTRKTPLGVGEKSLERRSTFASHGGGLKRRAIADRKAETKSRRTFTPASPEQRRHIAGRVSIVSGESPCDPCHLTPRAHGGCDAALCCIPLTRAEHRAFDDGQLDVLPYLIAHGLWAEMAHAVEAHRIDPIALVHRCTGERYMPERQAA